MFVAEPSKLFLECHRSMVFFLVQDVIDNYVFLDSDTENAP
jgi:hypothetical protein